MYTIVDEELDFRSGLLKFGIESPTSRVPISYCRISNRTPPLWGEVFAGILRVLWGV